jgi:hypothetical protein
MAALIGNVDITRSLLVGGGWWVVGGGWWVVAQQETSQGMHSLSGSS